MFIFNDKLSLFQSAPVDIASFVGLFSFQTSQTLVRLWLTLPTSHGFGKREFSHDVTSAKLLFPDSSQTKKFLSFGKWVIFLCKHLILFGDTRMENTLDRNKGYLHWRWSLLEVVEFSQFSVISLNFCPDFSVVSVTFSPRLQDFS